MADSNQTFQIIGIIIILAIVAFGIYYYMNMQGKKQQDMMNQQMMDAMKQKMMQEVADVKMQIKEGFENQQEEEEKKDESKMVDENGTEHFADQGQMMGNPMAGKQQLTAGELLPNDNSSQWAQVYPTGEGSLKDRNFLQAGYHIGINTVGQTLRNANMQLRSEPPAPQVKVSPWLQSTIEPDLGRKPFEIGGCM